MRCKLFVQKTFELTGSLFVRLEKVKGVLLVRGGIHGGIIPYRDRGANLGVKGQPTERGGAAGINGQVTEERSQALEHFK